MRIARTGLPLLALLLSTGLRADEGMWTFDNLPVKKMQAAYGFTPDQAWTDHVRLSALRFPGGSGSFVSKDGLVLTNHHVGHDWIQKVSAPGKDYVKDGFVATSREQEIPVPGLKLMSLVEMENVTAKVMAAAKPGMTDEQAATARREALAALVKEDQGKSKFQVEPVTLYQGGEFWLYRYKTFSDVRLVMAPEYAVAAFGKDWDNFTYPRHDLDFSLFRVYEDGKPYATPHHLQWSAKGAAYSDMTFTVGHPGTTNRLWTVAQIRYARNVATPLYVARLDRMRKALHEKAAKSEEDARQVSAQLMGIENSYKVLSGELEGMKDEAVFKRLDAAEAELKAKVLKDPKLTALAGQSWTRIEGAMKAQAGVAKERMVLSPQGNRVAGLPVAFLRYVAETAKPEAKRLKEFQDPKAVQALHKQLTEDMKLDAAKETETFGKFLADAQAELGAKHPLVAALLKGRSPQDAAKAILSGTTLLEPAARKALLDKGAKAVATSKDPLLAFGRVLEAADRKSRATVQGAQDVVAEHQTRIAKARFAVYGKDVYPDATFTLRLSYGKVETYPASGTLMQPFTTFGGMYDRADAWGPKAERSSWALPQRWLEARGKLSLSTPYNFITTNDITGGNSGSPVVNRKGEVVGLAFDGNIESLVGRYWYDGRANRTLCVDTRAILECLDKVFQAPNLVNELTGK